MRSVKDYPQPPRANQLRIGMQKKDGRLFDASNEYMKNWGIDLPASHPGDKPHELLTAHSRWGEVSVLTCRLVDVVGRVVDGLLDVGLVSSDYSGLWENAEREIMTRTGPLNRLDLKLAGSSLRFGIRADFMDQKTANWREAINYCRRHRLPVMTSNKSVLERFLKDERLLDDRRRGSGLPAIMLIECGGTVEAQGVLARTPLICDLIDTGNTMRTHGYSPQLEVEIAHSRIVLIGCRPKRGERQNTYDQLWQLAKADAAPVIS
jgi:ATP phosphoribosyltransferase